MNSLGRSSTMARRYPLTSQRPMANRICRLSSPEQESIFGGVVSDRDRATIVTLARRYGAAKVWLFGSSAGRRRRGQDLDLAVEGVAPGRFFQFVGELMLSLSQPVDVVALEKQSKLNALIRREGVPIYGQPAREG